MNNFWEYIAHSNVVNFLIVFAIFVWIFFAVFKDKINLAHKNAIEEVKNSDIEKQKSFEKLSEIKVEYESLELEISEIMDKAKEIIDKTEDRLNQDLCQIESNFSDNANKIIKRQIENINKKTQQEIVSLAISKAEEKIKDLIKDEKIHRQFISNAIDEIDRVQL